MRAYLLNEILHLEEAHACDAERRDLIPRSLPIDMQYEFKFQTTRAADVCEAVDLLGSAGKELLPALRLAVAKLPSTDQAPIWCALERMAGLSEAERETALLGWNDSDPVVRFAYLKTFTQTKPVPDWVRRQIERATKDNDPSVSHAAEKALNELSNQNQPMTTRVFRELK